MAQLIFMSSFGNCASNCQKTVGGGAESLIALTQLGNGRILQKSLRTHPLIMTCRMTPPSSRSSTLSSTFVNKPFFYNILSIAAFPSYILKKQKKQLPFCVGVKKTYIACLHRYTLFIS